MTDSQNTVKNSQVSVRLRKRGLALVRNGGTQSLQPVSWNVQLLIRSSRPLISCCILTLSLLHRYYPPEFWDQKGFNDKCNLNAFRGEAWRNRGAQV